MRYVLFFVLTIACSSQESSLKYQNDYIAETGTSGSFYRYLSRAEFDDAKQKADAGNAANAYKLALHYVGKSLHEKRGPDAYEIERINWLRRSHDIGFKEASRDLIDLYRLRGRCDEASEILNSANSRKVLSVDDRNTYAIELKKCVPNVDIM
jgi:hypothetical protein